jgi:hypothetical protein
VLLSFLEKSLVKEEKATYVHTSDNSIEMNNGAECLQTEKDRNIKDMQFQFSGLNNNIDTKDSQWFGS